MRPALFFAGIVTALLLSGPPAASAQTPPSATAAAPIDPAKVHRAFRVTAEEVSERVREGKAFAEKKQTEKDVLGKYTRTTKVTRGSASVLPGEARCFGLNGNMLTFESYRAALQKKEPEIPADLKQGGFTKALLFRFFLLSATTPEKNAKGNGRAPTATNLLETTVVRVILADDQGNSAEAVRLVKSDGEDPAPTPAAPPLPGPTYRVLFAEPTMEGRPFYTRHYQAVFPLFGPDGAPLVPPDVRKITLRIITSVGEQTADFTL